MNARERLLAAAEHDAQIPSDSYAPRHGLPYEFGLNRLSDIQSFASLVDLVRAAPHLTGASADLNARHIDMWVEHILLEVKP